MTLQNVMLRYMLWYFISIVLFVTALHNIPPKGGCMLCSATIYNVTLHVAVF